MATASSVTLATSSVPVATLTLVAPPTVTIGTASLSWEVQSVNIIEAAAASLNRLVHEVLPEQQTA